MRLVTHCRTAAALVGLLLGLLSPARGEDAAAPDRALQRRVFTKCAACHNTVKDGTQEAGPSLYGVFGAPAGAKSGFDYSAALKNSHIVWNDQTLDQFLTNPQVFLPGNRMPFPGLPSARDRAAVIAYLKSSTTTS